MLPSKSNIMVKSLGLFQDFKIFGIFGWKGRHTKGKLSGEKKQTKKRFLLDLPDGSMVYLCPRIRTNQMFFFILYLAVCDILFDIRVKLISFSAEPVLLCGGKLLWRWARRSRIPSLKRAQGRAQQHGAARSVAGGCVLLTSAHGSRVLPLVSVIQAVGGLCRGALSSVKAHLAALASITKSPVPAVLAQLATHFRTQPPVLTSKRSPETPAWFSGWCFRIGSNLRYTLAKLPQSERQNPNTWRLKDTGRDLNADSDEFSVEFFSLCGPLGSVLGKASTFACSLSHETVIFDASRSANKTRYATLIDSTSVTVTVAAANVLLLIPRKETFLPPMNQFDLTHGSLAMTHTQAVVLNYTINISAIQLCPWNDK